MATKLDFILSAQDAASKELLEIKQHLQDIGKQVEKGGKQASASSISFTKLFGSFTAADLAAGAIRKVTSAVSALPAKMVMLAASQEQTNIAFETMLGSAQLAEETLAELYDFARTTPFTITGIEDSSKLLLAMGITADELKPTLKSLGDVAAGLSVPLEQVALAYGQVRAANQLYGTELRQFINAGIPILGQLADQFGTTEAAVKKMVENGLVSFADVEEAFTSMTSEGGRFEDLMARQSETVAGKWSNLQDSAILLSRDLGGALMPAVENVTDALLGNVDSIREYILTSEGQLRPELQSAVDTLGDLATSTMTLATESLPALIDAISGVASVTKPAVDSMKFLYNITVDVIGALNEAERAMHPFREAALQAQIAIDSTAKKYEEYSTNIEDANSRTKKIGLTTEETKERIQDYSEAFGGLEAASAALGISMEEVNKVMEITENTVDDGAGGMETYSGSAKKAIKETDTLADSVGDMGGAYGDFEETGVAAVLKVKSETAKALDDLEDGIADVRSEMESLTASFLEQTAGGKADMATAYVEQEEKVRDLRAELAELQAEQEPDTGRIAEVQAELDAELAALESFADKSAEIQAQIEEARRRAGLTDFERTIEDLENEQSEREDAFNAEMEQLSERLLALEEQRLKIQELSDSSLKAINDLQENGWTAYNKFITDMKDKTEEDVNAMILKFEALAESMETIGGVELAGEVGGAALEEGGGGTSIQIGDIIVQTTGTGTESPQELAQMISDAVQRGIVDQLENINIGQ